MKTSDVPISLKLKQKIIVIDKSNNEVVAFAEVVPMYGWVSKNTDKNKVNTNVGYYIVRIRNNPKINIQDDLRILLNGQLLYVYSVLIPERKCLIVEMIVSKVRYLA